MQEKQKLIDYLQKFFPDFTLEKIIASQKDPFDINEKRYAVVMFADISGFTSFSELLSAEQVTYIMNYIFSILGTKVKKYNGMIDKFLGDCILCVFGIIDGNEPEQDACICALEIMNSIDSISLEMKEKYSININMSIGINAGELVIGTIGYSERMEYTVIGDTVNTASRIQHEANPGEIYISDSVNKRVKSLFSIELIGERKLKNKKDPVMLYKLINHQHSLKYPVTTFDLLGRKKELDALENMYTTAKQMFTSVTISGDSGIGKTSLVHHFCMNTKKLNETEVIYLSGDKYHSDSSWYPIKDFFKHTNTSNDLNNKTENKDSIKVAFINTILSVLDTKQCCILFADDIHAFDNDSLDIIQSIQTTLHDKRIILIMTQWLEDTLIPCDFTIQLQGLDEISTRQLCERILKNTISDRVASYVHQRTMGNPYYIYELINDLYDNKTIDKLDLYDFVNEEYQKIPFSVSNCILQKIDKLNYEEKKLIRYASLCAIKVEIELLQSLTTLNDSEFARFLEKINLLTIAHTDAELSVKYLQFSHQTTQDAISRSILDKPKQNIHKEIAEKSLLLYIEKNGSFYERVAFHFENAHIYIQAILYYFLSANEYRNKFDTISATKNIEKAIQLSKHFPIDAAFGMVSIIDSNIDSWYIGFNIETELTRSLLYTFNSLSFSINDKEYLSNLENAIECGFSNDLLKYRTIERKLLALNYFREISLDDVISSFNTLLSETKNPITDFVFTTDILFLLLRVYEYTGYIKSMQTKIEDAFTVMEKAFSELEKSDIDCDYNYNMLCVLYQINKAYYYCIQTTFTGIDNTALIIKTIEFGTHFIQSDSKLMSYYSSCALLSIWDNKTQLEYNIKSFSLAKTTGDVLTQSRLNSSIGYKYLEFSGYNKALEYFLQAVDICTKAGYIHELSMVYYNISIAYFLTDNFKTALEYSLKSMELKKAFPHTFTTSDWTSVIFPKTLIGVLYFAMESYENTIIEIEECMKFEALVTNTKFYTLCLLLINLSNNYIINEKKIL